MRWNLIKIRSCAIFRCFHRFDSFFHLFLGRWISCFLIGWYSLIDSCSRRNERKASAFIVQQAALKRKPWVPEDLFFLNDIDGSRREAPREKNNLASQELGVDHISHQTGLELMCMFVFIDADSWDLIVHDSTSAMHEKRIARKLT